LVSKQPFYTTSYRELWSVSLSHHVILVMKLPRLHLAVCAYSCVNGPWQRNVPYTVLGPTTLAVVGKGHKLKAIELSLYCSHANCCQLQHTKMLHYMKEGIICSCISLGMYQNQTQDTVYCTSIWYASCSRSQLSRLDGSKYTVSVFLRPCTRLGRVTGQTTPT
jgi:hypothetical protein